MKKLKNPYLTLLLLILTGSQIIAQETYILNGVVTDASSNETLVGVNIIVPEAKTGVITNDYGYYSIRLPEGEYSIEVSYLGYQSKRSKVLLNANEKLDIQLFESSENLEEIVITSNIEGLNIKKPEMSVNKLSIGTIQKLPVVFGEVDVVKSLLLLPGVSNAGEGSSGFNV
ncbi:MAG: carboxypeptidase-like regulatory domain-containing protein, partial [Gramella sp.]|nr:carboxypeptidase-like regulatory domain-containing protein [Christiangramia sp.]